MIVLVQKTLHERWLIGYNRTEILAGVRPLTESIPFYRRESQVEDDRIDAEVFLSMLYIPRYYYSLWAPVVSDNCFLHPWLLENRRRLVDPRLFAQIKSSILPPMVEPERVFGLLTMWQMILENRDISQVTAYARVPKSYRYMHMGEKSSFISERIYELKRQAEGVVMPDFPSQAEIVEFLYTTRIEAGGRYACLG